ncbi:MAG: hypothetical protein ACHQ1H_11585, partial [Nitrososphaerales archaeon]
CKRLRDKKDPRAPLTRLASHLLQRLFAFAYSRGYNRVVLSVIYREPLSQARENTFTKSTEDQRSLEILKLQISQAKDTRDRYTEIDFNHFMTQEIYPTAKAKNPTLTWYIMGLKLTPVYLSYRIARLCRFAG